MRDEKIAWSRAIRATLAFINAPKYTYSPTSITISCESNLSASATIVQFRSETALTFKPMDFA